ncbi:MAG: hypothetical protein CME06_03210 [Gemmatimonadetes bacterium]|nr:hypothetical protein [Gemmatimonadota bacterium]
MKLALIYPPFYAKQFNENLGTVDDQFGLFPHVAFGWIAAVAKQCGWQVRLIDAAAERIDPREAIDQIESWNPDLLGFAAHAAQTIQDMYGWARVIRRETGIASMVGGYEAKAYPHEIMEQGCFDFLAAGDAPAMLPEFLSAFERGHGYEDVPSLVYQASGEARFSGRTAPHIPFSEFPIPDRSIFPNHLYYSHVSQRRNFTIGISEVGCPYPCSFCCMRRTGFSARSPEQVIEELEQCIALGIREIDWFDPLMLHDRTRVIEIAREIKRRRLDIIWSCRSRVDSLSFHRAEGAVDEELIESLAEGGCRRIYFGIESGDDAVLKQMSKGQKICSTQRNVLASVREAGIMSLGFFILGAPGDTPETCKRTVSLALSLPLSYAQFQIAIIKPHTELERDHIVEGSGIDYWRDYVRGRVGERELPNPWTEMSRAALEATAKRAYFQFYARPRYILMMLRRIESSRELYRYARVALQLLLRPVRASEDSGRSRPRRLGRAAGAFVEAVLNPRSQGARHPVIRMGGGIRGACRLAMAEWRWRREEKGVDPASPVPADPVNGAIIPPPAPTQGAHVLPGRYVPFLDAIPFANGRAISETAID